MQKIQLLRLRFENEFEQSEITAVRAAVAQKIGKDNILFHHHIDNEKVLFRYPLIQYKLSGKQLLVLCLCEAVDEIQKFLQLKNWDIRIHREQVSLKVDSIRMNAFTLNVWDKAFTYRLHNWMALNPENYRKYFSTVSMAERIQLLEKTLTAHIIAFAEGVKWNVEKQVKVTLHNIHKERWSEYKGIKFWSPDIAFSTNVSLPDYAGLGRAVSVGFGVVRRIKQRNTEEKSNVYETTRQKTNASIQTPARLG